MRTFKPLGDRLLVRPDAPIEKQTTGLSAPPSQKEQPTEGIVVAVGEVGRRQFCDVVDLPAPSLASRSDGASSTPSTPDGT